VITDFIQKHIDEKSERIQILIDIVVDLDMANMRIASYLAMQPETKMKLKQYLVDLDALRTRAYRTDIPAEEILAGFESVSITLN